MSQLALSVCKLSKRFRIGEYTSATTLREAIVGVAGSVLRHDEERRYLWALKDVSFEVQQGEVLGIVGRNGAGKSTLLKLLSRITYPTSGSLKVAGRVASLLEVGTGFHDELTGRENIYLNGSILGMKRREINQRLDEIVEFSGIGRQIDTPIKRYSSGMRLRLGFAVAAHLSPDILLVDEVLAVGDADFQKKCLDAMDGMRTSGRTVLFVSHNMAAVEHLCSRCIWIEAGQVRADSDARSVVSEYMKTFAQASSGKIDLTEIETRTGNGEGRFTHFEFLNERGEIKNVIRSGDKLTMRLYYRANKTLIDLVIGINILTEYGTLLTSINNWATGDDIPIVNVGDGYADLEIDCLNLQPGRFYLSLWLGKYHHQMDVLKNCIAFDVEAADCYGSGRGIEPRFGLIYLPSRWKSCAPQRDQLAEA
jgi:homopolymeric O-antigen transport system ATP-binding protein